MNARLIRPYCLIIATVAMCLLLNATASHAGVLGWWTMDDPNYPAGSFTPASTPDSTANGNNAVLNGTVAIHDGVANFGSLAGALDCGTDASIKTSTNGYTFATWVKFDSLPASNAWQMIGSDWRDGGGLSYHFAAHGSDLELFVRKGDNSGNLSYRYTTNKLVVDRWTHVAFTFAPTTESATGEVKLFLDGNSVGTIPFDYGSMNVTAEPIVLGAKTIGGINNLRGQLDETAIWTSTLSQTDILSLAQKTSTPSSISPTTLGGCWDYTNPVALPTATVLDSSGNGRHGTMTPNGVDPFHPEAGRFDGAVRLGGPLDYIDVGDINYDNEITIAAWVKPDALSGWQIIASQANDITAGDWAWQICLHGTNARFFVFDTTDDWGGIEVAPVTAVTTDWTHLAMTITANKGETLGEVKAYVNGVQVGDTFVNDRASLVNSSEPIRFGNKGNITGTYAFKGLMDDVVLFDRALSSEEITLIYQQGAAALIPEPSVAMMILCGFGLLAALRRR